MTDATSSLGSKEEMEGQQKQNERREEYFGEPAARVRRRSARLYSNANVLRESQDNHEGAADREGDSTMQCEKFWIMTDTQQPMLVWFVWVDGQHACYCADGTVNYATRSELAKIEATVSIVRRKRKEAVTFAKSLQRAVTTQLERECRELPLLSQQRWEE